MKVILFLVYYSKLQLGVLFGFHNTLYPTGIAWRWAFWKRSYGVRLEQSAVGRASSLLGKKVFRR